MARSIHWEISGTIFEKTRRQIPDKKTCGNSRRNYGEISEANSLENFCRHHGKFFFREINRGFPDESTGGIYLKKTWSYSLRNSLRNFRKNSEMYSLEG